MAEGKTATTTTTTNTNTGTGNGKKKKSQPESENSGASSKNTKQSKAKPSSKGVKASTKTQPKSSNTEQSSAAAGGGGGGGGGGGSLKFLLLLSMTFVGGWFSSPHLTSLLNSTTSEKKQSGPRDGVESLPKALHDEFFSVPHAFHKRRREGQLDDQDDEEEDKKKMGVQQDYDDDDEDDEEWSSDDYDYEDYEDDEDYDEDETEEEAFRRLYQTGTAKDEALLDLDLWDHKLSLVIHRNGEAQPCASAGAGIDLAKVIRDEIELLDTPLAEYTKFDFDALLTAVIADILDQDACAPQTTTSSNNHHHHPEELAFLTHCDRGEKHTPLLHDHQHLVPVKGLHDTFYPCHFHTREGMRIGSLRQFVELIQSAGAREKDGSCTAAEKNENEDNNNDDDDDKTRECQTAIITQLHLYTVPTGRNFMFAPSYIGETFFLSHVSLPNYNDDSTNTNQISLKVLSVQPRVFDILHFFSKEESDEVVEVALSETAESHRMKRSSTGASGYRLNSKRTSENAFVTHKPIATKIKRRCFEVLGLDTYVESMADGLQVLRYNKTAAYIDHLDWIEDPQKRQEHDYDSEGVGTNRYATILLYMSDLPEDGGGETVFVRSKKRGDFQTALRELRHSKYGDLFEKGSWEEKLTTQCKTRMSVKPRSARAVLFYSQNPDGSADFDSLHGGCPVLRGEKMAANLWVWNGPRAGYEESPKNAWVEEKRKLEAAKGKQQQKQNKQPPAKPSPSGSVHASFQNSGQNSKYDKAKLYYEDQYWGELGLSSEPLNVNTFEDHRWFVKVDGKTVVTWVMDGRPEQIYKL